MPHPHRIGPPARMVGTRQDQGVDCSNARIQNFTFMGASTLHLTPQTVAVPPGLLDCVLLSCRSGISFHTQRNANFPAFRNKPACFFHRRKDGSRRRIHSRVSTFSLDFPSPRLCSFQFHSDDGVHRGETTVSFAHETLRSSFPRKSFNNRSTRAISLSCVHESVPHSRTRSTTN